ncbi:MAG: hypothetical protein LC130_28980 [Bryobacterales bacterium]|nr:hypothetical protein [Bryobacterales bacterium]MEB2361274.1 hypothetical protein [Bryobacterales bacterium]
MRRGIRAGHWQFITSEQLQWLMRPEQEFRVRVWACGMLHSIGQKRRLAVKWINLNGKQTAVPLSPADITAELNALDTIGRACRQHVRRALADLEAQGAVRRVGELRDKIRLYFYLRPLTQKRVRREEPENGFQVAKFGYLTPLSPTNNNHLRDAYFSHKTACVVKSFLRTAREVLIEAGLDSDQVAKSGYLKLVEETAENLAQVAKSGYQKLLQVAKSAPPYKEDSIVISNGGDTVPPSSSNTPPIVENTPEPETTTTTEKDPVLEALNTYGPAEQEAAETLTMKCRAMAPDSTTEEIAVFVHMAAQQTARNPNIRNQIGVLLKKVPALLRTHLPARRSAAEAERRTTELLREKNRLEWQAWLNDPEASEDDKAFARRMLQENQPDQIIDDI